MIRISNGSLSYGSQILFDSINLAFLDDQRIGVLGRNGTGKSTLLKIISGKSSFDNGSVTIDRYKKIGYMPQEMVLLSTKNVLAEALSVFDADLKVEEGEIPSAYDEAMALKRTEKILTGLGFSRIMFEQPVEQLSVGWKMRLVLAKLLLEEADFYLFDEPTNHLDLPTKEWFFNFLREGRFGFLLVSHDRHYLDKACDYILALERSKATFFKGNLTDYIKDYERQREVTASAYHRQQKEIAKKEATIERFRASASKAKMAQSMIKQLDKIERIEIEPVLPTIKLNFPQGIRPGDVVLTLQKVQHAFDEKSLFQNVHATIKRGDRVALVAPNGTGKTTLFNLITGKYNLQHGTIQMGHNVNYAVFEQDQMRALNGKNTVLEEILQAIGDIPEGVIRTFLGSFLFSGDTIYKKVSVLSGGERNRVAMIKVLLQKANLLLLDEPTNHLDLYAKEVLEQALKQYQGTMLFVSHDHSFIEALATRVWELTPQGLYDYPGTYESYLYAKKHQEGAVNNARENVKTPTDQQTASTKLPQELHALRKELGSIEAKITRLEREIEMLTQSFLTLTYGSIDYDTAAVTLKEKQQLLKTLMEQWENVQSSLKS